MQNTFVCRACGRMKSINYRLKQAQAFCSERTCQRARKRLWQQRKMKTDISYRNQQRACLKRWRKMRPLHLYQKLYREQNPNYVKRNREQQRRRNRQRNSNTDRNPIVKMDAFQPIESGFYLLTPWAHNMSKKIVKMDALLVELKAFQDPLLDTRVYPT